MWRVLFCQARLTLQSLQSLGPLHFQKALVFLQLKLSSLSPATLVCFLLVSLHFDVVDLWCAVVLIAYALLVSVMVCHSLEYFSSLRIPTVSLFSEADSC